MRVALGQINTTVGDLSGNADKMVHTAREAAARGADLVVFPELSLTGYPPRDLVEKDVFLDRTEQHLRRLCAETASLGPAIVCGYVARSESPIAANRVNNSAAVIDRGEIVFRQNKMLLPTYDVFDEARYFVPAEKQSLLKFRGGTIGLTICEDAWNDKQYWDRRRYARDPVEELVSGGAGLLVSINASPYHMGKRTLRRDIFAAAARRHRLPIVYVNQAGGNDHLVFDGTSFVMSADGRVLASARSFAEDLVLWDVRTGAGDQHADLADECEAVYEALVLGTRDYIHKCGFGRVLLGLSGGIDSSLTAALAVDAVGRENVTGVGMPGPFSSEGSLRDARALAENLGIRLVVAPISGTYGKCLEVLDPLFGECPRDATEENIQSRLRGLTLMALSNKWGALVLTTGNKSELAVGYCTLYGDMCGGLAVISDVPKTLVYTLARVANRRHGNAIPEAVFAKAPSAELRPNQRDTDTLPEYDVLDRILTAYIEDYLPAREIAEQFGYPLELVRDIINKVDHNEYKRQQAAPGIKVTAKAFGWGRRFPIAQRFVE